MAKQALQGGKRPISQKNQAFSKPIREDELFGNMLKLDPETQAELEAQGLAWRFVDAKKLMESGGYHAKGWSVYKRKADSGTIGSSEFKFGSDPDGIIRRGSLVLAVKTKEAATRHKEFLRQKAERYSAIVPQQAEALRQVARENNVDTVVDDTYDEND